MQTVMNRRTNYCLVLATIWAVSPSYADSPCDENIDLNESWEMVYQTSSSRIYEPQYAGNRPPSALVNIKWEFNPDRVYRSIWDYNDFPAFIPNVLVSRILKQNANQVWVYQRLQLPPPARDRHYVLQSTDAESLPARHHYRVEWQLDKEFPKPEKILLIRGDNSDAMEIRNSILNSRVNRLCSLPGAS